MKCPGLKGTHLDWTMSLEDRLVYLAKAASLEEKIGQMTNDAPAIVHLGIPGYNWLNDDEHGVRESHSTQFPDGCGLGASWSKKTLHDVGWIVGEEARALHNGFVHSGNRGHHENGAGITMYAPNMNLVRDPRWGRAQEVYSEDPYLSAQLTYNFVSAAQGNFSGKYLLAAACCKHYAAYDLESLPESRVTFSATVNSRNLWETYLPVFKACVQNAQAGHVMCSYNAINGVPTCGDADLLNGVLRDQWKWPGFVVSDYDAWAMIQSSHHYCPDLTCAAAVGLKAGLDQEGGGTAAISALPKALDIKNVTEDNIDTAFKRLFRIRVLLGMLDPPTMVAWNYLSNMTSESPQHVELALQAGREAICLYKNTNNTLPLSTSINKIAVIGPSADQTGLLLGNYATYPDSGVVSILSGIESALGLNPANITADCTVENNIDYFVQGQGGSPSPNATDCCIQCMLDPACQYYTWYEGACYKKTSDQGQRTSQGRISGKCLSKPSGTGRVTYSAGCTSIQCPDSSGFDNAVKAAEGADAIVVAMGLDQLEESEGHDRSVIELPGMQSDLVAALRKAHSSTPLIIVLVHGGTLGLGKIIDNADAIVDAWYPGMQGGNAVADVLFGKYNPGGRTPVTYYKSTSDLPPPGTMDPYPNDHSHGLTYRFFNGEPQYPFGYGLSYTMFTYSNIQVNSSMPKACDVIGVNVTVKNTGNMDGDEVVQLYVKQPAATVPVPQVRLADFERVTISKGSSVTVQLVILPEFHSVVYDSSNIYQGQIAVEKGPLEIYVGGGQPQFYSGHVNTTVTVENTQMLDTC
jgi:beta-glucosidase